MFEYDLLEQTAGMWKDIGGGRTEQVSYLDELNRLAHEGWSVVSTDVKIKEIGTYADSIRVCTMIRRELPDLEELAEQTQEILDGHND